MSYNTLGKGGGGDESLCSLHLPTKWKYFSFIAHTPNSAQADKNACNVI